ITTYRTTDLSVVDTFTINKTTQEAPSSKPSTPSAPTAYAVNLADMDNGSVVSSAKSASKGSTVTLTVTPDQGYELADLTVTDKSGKELTLTQKGDGVYTFTMPASKVTVSADFQEIQVPASQLPFTDVAEKDWFYDGVSFVYEKGIMNGLTATTFGPSASTTRGMVVTMLWRMEDQPQAQSGAAFADVKEGAYYAQAIDWAAENGIVNGTSDTTFAPDQSVTRQQLAAILYRYSQYKGYDVTAQGDLTTFGDWEQVSDYAVEPMEWAVGSALIQGIDDNLVPGGSATRAQLATIFSRFITNFGS
ncbi:MAG: S-layer homology domain-containing protein, partial [Ruminiclostridium sp.]|nr:S-layer homology domain-containing protein [Ruminiclostridium sp.]